MKCYWTKVSHAIKLCVDLYNWHYQQNIEMTIRLKPRYKKHVRKIDTDLRLMMQNRKKVTLQELETLILGKEDQYDT